MIKNVFREVDSIFFLKGLKVAVLLSSSAPWHHFQSNVCLVAYLRTPLWPNHHPYGAGRGQGIFGGNENERSLGDTRSQKQPAAPRI